MLEIGRSMEFPSGHLLNSVAWVSTTKYLRKQLRHLAVGETLYDVWHPFIATTLHLGLNQMRPVLKGLSWHQPDLALHLLNRYVGSRWLWVCPILTPSRLHLTQVLTHQAAALQSLMHLYIPEDTLRAPALALHRLRRRCVLVFLSRLPAKCWSYQWQQRAWNYAGHVLRRPENHPTKAVLLSLHGVRRPPGGYPNSHLDWLIRVASKAYGQHFSLARLLDAASNRETWASQGGMHFRWILESEAHRMMHPGLWERWQDAILQQVPWLFHAVLIQSAAGYTVVWVDTTEGLVTWDLGDFVYSNLWTYGPMSSTRVCSTSTGSSSWDLMLIFGML